MSRSATPSLLLRLALAGGLAAGPACAAPPAPAPAESTGEAPAMTAATLEAELRAALPAGTPLDRVEAHLAARGFEHGAPVATDAMAHLGRRGAKAAAGAALRLHAIRRDVATTPLARTALAVTLDFDADNRLIALHVEEVHTGL